MHKRAHCARSIEKNCNDYLKRCSSSQILCKEKRRKILNPRVSVSNQNAKNKELTERQT